MVKVLRVLSNLNKLNIPFLWKYFVTSHGKDVIDSVGCNVKSLVRQQLIAQRENSLVQCAADFVTIV